MGGIALVESLRGQGEQVGGPKCPLHIDIFFYIQGSRFLHNLGHGWQRRRRRREGLGFWIQFRGVSICFLLCESGELRSNLTGSIGECWLVFFSSLFSLKILLLTTFLFLVTLRIKI